MTRISSLHIENFRAIGELDYSPHQINLIIGQNNTGKSALLDAIYINVTGKVIGSSRDSANENYNIKNQMTRAIINSDINKVTLYKSLEDCRKEDPDSYAEVQSYIIERLSKIIEDGIEGTDEYKDQLLAIFLEFADFVVALSEYSFNTNMYFPNGQKELIKKIDELDRTSDGVPDKSKRDARQILFRIQLFPSWRTKWFQYSNKKFKEQKDVVNKLAHSDKFMLDKMGDEEIHLLETFIIEHNLVKNIKRLTQKNVLYQKDDEIETIPISAHGDGFVALLTTLHNLIQSENGILIIEEPENHLHPRYLRVLIETLFTYCKQLNVQVFMATHSYDLIKEALEYPESKDEKDMLLISKMTSDGYKIEKFDYTTDEALKVTNELYLDLRGI